MSELQDFSKNILGVKLSSGYIAKSILRVSSALKKPYEDALEKVRYMDIESATLGYQKESKRLWKEKI